VRGPAFRVSFYFMNKRLEQILERVAEWPPDAQEDLLATFEGIEMRGLENSTLSAEEREAKLSALRQTIHDSIERGGSHTDQAVGASISAALDSWERDRKSA